MKNLSSLGKSVISVMLLVIFACHPNEKSNSKIDTPNTTPESRTDSLEARGSLNLSKLDSFVTQKTPAEQPPVHHEPDQRKIDSLKAIKTKLKQN